jgi:pimeloyl-ACP methyl ester carboxylesterase
MHKSILLLLATLLFTGLYAQQSEKIFLDNADSTHNYYTAIIPPKLPWKGFFVLLPGFGEDAANVMSQTKLPLTATRNGLFVIIPTLQDGVLSLGADSASQQTLTTIISHASERYKLQDLPFYIGGFSIGGTTAIKFAENNPVKPEAVFAIDPPLDFERFYMACERNIRLSVNTPPNQESMYMIQRLQQATGGTPQTALSAYYQLSPYSYSDTTQKAIKKITNVPLRIYSEPDINWWMKERGFDLTGINVTECSAMINELNLLGSTKSELILTQNKGYRKPYNHRHPHSWSIADSDELVKWLMTNK